MVNTDPIHFTNHIISCFVTFQMNSRQRSPVQNALYKFLSLFLLCQKITKTYAKVQKDGWWILFFLLNYSSLHGLTLSRTSSSFYVSAVQVFWKHRGKRRNCSLRAISPFPTVFSTHLENFLPFLWNFRLSSANSLRLEESKICRLGKG